MEASQFSSMEASTGWDSNYQYEPSRLFEQTFRCLPYSKYSNPDLQIGDKIMMPQSALERILQLGLRHPFLFKIEGFNSDKISHCGVLQFDAEEGVVHLPDWMMKNMNLRDGAHVIVRDAQLSRGAFMKLQPHATAFINLSNPKAVLEQGLRGFTCLSRGDTFVIKHGDTDFWFDVVEVCPGDAICLIDTDCVLDFAPPLDYKEPEPEPDCVKKRIGIEKEEGEEEVKVFRPFSGAARRLDGTAVVGGAAVKEEEGKKSANELFKPFSGRSRVLGGGPL